VKAGINTICIHEGSCRRTTKSFAGVWQYATADDGQGRQGWPQMNFVIYHSALRPFLELPDRRAEFGPRAGSNGPPT
jgi:hypothetical protein